MQPITIVSIVIVAAFLTTIVRMVRTRRLRAKYSFLWLMVGVVVLVIAVVPGVLERLSALAGIYYPPAFLFLCATALLLFIAVHFSWELSRLEDRTRTLIEEHALLAAEVAELRADRGLAVPGRPALVQHDAS